MKFAHLKTAAFATAVALSFSGCNLIGDGVCSNPSGDVLSETVIVEEFTSIDVATIGDVYLSEGASQEIRVEAEQEVLDLMDIQVINGELKIDLDACFQGSFTFNVYVTIPTGTRIEGVKVSGAGDLETTTPIEVADEFSMTLGGAGGAYFDAKNENESVDLDVSGAGTAEVDVRSNRVDVDIAGSGDVELLGSTKSLVVNISGSGDLEAFELEARSANLTVGGSGMLRLPSPEMTSR